MKKRILVLFLLIIGVVVLLWMKGSSGPLSNLQRQINSQIEVVYKTGQDSKVIFFLPEEGGMLVISPPYANISELGKNVFNPELQEKIEYLINVQEAGHLFYIKRGNLADHRRLSGLVEPVLGMGAKREIVFLISRKPTSGRPVRIEIINGR